MTLPSFIIDFLVAQEINYQLRQINYFRTRRKAGAIIKPEVFQPVFEPEKGVLVAVLTEPGAAHLIFRDEVAPIEIWDKVYREVRKESLGRTADIESVEIIDNRITFQWCGSLPLNPYELGFHPSLEEHYTGKIYSSTWNHMMSGSESFPIVARGGYKEVEYQLFTGSRDDAEEYAKKIIG